MYPYPNLISESILINETIELLQSFGGSASAVEVVDYVMKISKPPAHLADSDPRLQLNDEIVELISLNYESRNLLETDFVVFDLETSGAKCPPCRITEIGAYRIEKGKIVGEFQTLVNPEMLIPPFITQLTGISDKMVENAPKFAEIATDFLDFIGEAVLVAHNAPFDMRFLNHEIGKVYTDYRVANPNICTVQLSRKLIPNIENHRLHTVAEHYSIYIENRHRAADDAHATAKIFVNLLNQLNELGVKDLETARKFKI
jgi:DNA polymerase III epsilon subunit family exonuclease